MTFSIELLESELLNSDKLGSVLDIYTESFDNNVRISTKLIKKRIRNNTYRTILFSDRGLLSGFAFVIPITHMNLIHIDYIAIADHQRGKGMGSKILNTILQDIKWYKNHKANFSLECEDKLVGFYQRFGFTLFTNNYQLANKRLNFMTTLNRGIRKSSIMNSIKNINDVLQIVDTVIQITNNIKIPFNIKIISQIVRALIREKFIASELFDHFTRNLLI